ncbi:response regulator, partial [Candidatus Acetothermia bacterium]|nr:response regulator [Candidatus Acetothermia bacterium]
KLLPTMQGQLGLDLAREHSPDLILLDMHLPDIQGYEVLQQLQTNPKTRQIPVVVISVDDTLAQMKQMLSAGAKDYLVKPLDVKQFLQVVDQILKN